MGSVSSREICRTKGRGDLAPKYTRENRRIRREIPSSRTLVIVAPAATPFHPIRTRKPAGLQCPNPLIFWVAKCLSRLPQRAFLTRQDKNYTLKFSPSRIRDSITHF